MESHLASTAKTCCQTAAIPQTLPGQIPEQKTKNKNARTLPVSTSEHYMSPLNENTFNKHYQFTSHGVMVRNLIAFYRALQHKTRVVCTASIYFTMTKFVELKETLTQ